ncbi:MAG: DUF721 domain-containing protein [Bacteroidaceae bacterium]|nr:DUF721 domain-containing protein [Bacteroidaceae bacterium]
MKRRESHSIGNLLRQYLRSEGLETPLNEQRLINAWPEVMGTLVSNYTDQLYIKNTVLFVKVSSAPLRQELSMRRALLVQKLNKQAGAQVITDIIIR